MLFSDGDYSYDKILAISKSNNAYNYMAIGYFVNANNIMYEKTNDIQYLEINSQVVENVRNSNNFQGEWRINVDANNQNSSSNGGISIVFEGYYYRYLAEYIYILQKNKVMLSEANVQNTFLKSIFDKWVLRSQKSFNDYSTLLHRNLHTGANWACVALFLGKENDENVYLDFVNQYDKLLKERLIEREGEGKKFYYIWNSSYLQSSTKYLRGIKDYSQELQDVSHGNHVINYILFSVKLGYVAWGVDDIIKFSNTLEYSIWNKEAGEFNELLINKNDGWFTWKISDGWLKLLPYCSNDFKVKVLDFYKRKRNVCNKSFLGLQFLSNLYPVIK
ncbi:hypothetical protein [Myroides odoratimimus]|uniref:hypothetical protein n=1 Tax=Myroides odoratimimus TaxID=76832 RepID=UPI00257707DE|nr:hypothetical protein [Myroides odoratimimus]MDM1521198.1 hypothetical protein [Myroides odoratimimus]